ncbi:ABC transporter transmembrane domain-containing protein [Pseudodesulfovibrio sp.]|nr:ABC transporter transmembrane domain-containing protein [Pseudodesulfovibrio sp.]
MKTSLILRSFKELPAYLKRRTGFILVIMTVQSVMETIFAALAALFVTCITNMDQVLQSSPIVRLQEAFPLQQFNDPAWLIFATGASLACITVCKNGLKAWLAHAEGKLAVHTEKYFGMRLLGNLFSMPSHWHSRQNTADHVLAVDWASTVGIYGTIRILQTVHEVITVMLLLGALVYASPLMSLLLMAAFGTLSYLLYAPIRTRVDEHALNCTRLRQSVQREATKSIHGIRDVRLFGLENDMLDIYSKQLDKLSVSAALQKVYSALPSLVIETVGLLFMTTCVIGAILASDMSAARLTGTVTLFAVVAWRSLPAASRLFQVVIKIRNNLPVIQYEFDLLDETDSGQTDLPHSGSVEPLQLKETITTEHLHFRYDDDAPDALRDICITIPKGAMFGIIGASGAGKSTLVDLLIGLSQPSGGGRCSGWSSLGRCSSPKLDG